METGAEARSAAHMQREAPGRWERGHPGEQRQRTPGGGGGGKWGLYPRRPGS
jgi:hypothetical protein